MILGVFWSSWHFWGILVFFFFFFFFFLRFGVVLGIWRIFLCGDFVVILVILCILVFLGYFGHFLCFGIVLGILVILGVFWLF
jgi:hypothetical protein